MHRYIYLPERSGRFLPGAAVLLLIMALLSLPLGAKAQTTIFSENFESATTGTTLLPAISWDFYVADEGNSRWAVGNASCAISGNKSMYVVRNTAANPCDYAPANPTNKIAYRTFSTTGFNNLTLSFKWICNGEKIGSTYYDYGRVCFSLNGTTWVDLPAYYQGQTTTQLVTDLALPAALNNQPTVYIGFRWVNDISTKNIPGFVVDDIIVKGNPAAPPVLTSLGSLSGCSGSSLVITGTALNGATSVTIGGTPATITANTPTSITVTIPTSATSGNVLVTTPIGTSNALPFTVNPTPSVTATPAAANLCDGATTAISLSSSTPATSYTWTAALLSGGPVSGFAPCTSGCGTTIAQTLSATATTPGTVRYTITPATATCTGTPVTADVTLYPNPAPTVTPASSSQCSGLATDLALSNGVTGATFSWTMPTITGGTVSGAAPGTSATAIAQTLVNTGTTAATLTYTITATNPGGGSASCTSAPVTATVIVTPGVQITTQPTAQTVCSGSAATFSVVAANATAYQWYGPSGLIPGATTATYTITGATPALSGNYYVAVSGPAGCPVLNSDMATLTVHPPVVITTQPLSQNVCQGTPLVLSVVASGALSYQWYKDGSPIAGATTPTYTTTAAPADAGAYYVRLTPGSPCTPLNSATATITITAAGTWKGITGDWNNAANWCGGVPTATTDVILPASGSVPFDAHILNGKLGEARTVTLQNSSLTVDNGGTLHLYGDLLQSPGGSFNAAGGTVRLAGTTAQHIKPSFSAATLMTAGGGSKELGGDVTVNNYLTLGSGNLLLNGHVLRLKPGASIYGISAASYVVTNGAGAAMVQTVSGADFIFPVGMSAFNPLYLSNGGVPDSFRVTLREEVLQGGTSGAPVNPSVSTVVKRTWDVSEGTPGGSIATLTLQWNGGEENSPAFNYEHAYVAQYVGGSGWLNTCCSVADSAGTAIGSGPYTRTKTGLSTFGSFTVASSAGDAPLVVGAGAGGQEGFGVRAWPNPVGEELRVEVRGGVAGGRVSLLDVTGRELQGQSTGASQQTIRFEMKGLPQGIYLLKYTDIYHNKTIKINKE